MTQVKRVNELNLGYYPHNRTEEAKYRYDCIFKYKKLREKGFDKKEALSFLGVCRSTFFQWLSKFNKKCGNLQMKTTELENNSRRPHNIRLANVISHKLVLHRKYERKYNCEKMHQSLNYLTPMDYYYTLKEKAA